METLLNITNLSKKHPDWSKISKETKAAFGGVYSEKKIQEDIDKVEKIYGQQKISEQKAERHSTMTGVENAENSAYLENAIQELVEDNLFSEYSSEKDGEPLDEDPDFEEIRIEPTHIFDDTVNHSDFTCVIKNSVSGNRPVPFVLDVTYNSNNEDINKKFSYTHPFKYKDIPGLITNKYFYDTQAFRQEDMVLPRGKIDMLPRFIVGFSPSLLEDNSPKTVEKRQLSILSELRQQSGQLLTKITEKYPDAPDTPADMLELISNLKILKAYFDRAYSIFDTKLRDTSQLESEIPASPLYGQNPDTYYNEIHNSVARDPAVSAINTTADITYLYKK